MTKYDNFNNGYKNLYESNWNYFDKIYKSFKYKIAQDSKYKQLNHYHVAPDLNPHIYIPSSGEHKFY